LEKALAEQDPLFQFIRQWTMRVAGFPHFYYLSEISRLVGVPMHLEQAAVGNALFDAHGVAHGAIKSLD